MEGSSRCWRSSGCLAGGGHGGDAGGPNDEHRSRDLPTLKTRARTRRAEQRCGECILAMSTTCSPASRRTLGRVDPAPPVQPRLDLVRLGEVVEGPAVIVAPPPWSPGHPGCHRERAGHPDRRRHVRAEDQQGSGRQRSTRRADLGDLPSVLVGLVLGVALQAGGRGFESHQLHHRGFLHCWLDRFERLSTGRAFQPHSGRAQHRSPGRRDKALSDLGARLGVQQVVLVATSAVGRGRRSSRRNKAGLEAGHAGELEQPYQPPWRSNRCAARS